MGFFTFVGNVVRGRFAHWNDTNNRALTELWERSQRLPDETRIPFQTFLGWLASVMDYLLGPNKGADRFIKKDPLQVTREQFTRMHTLILEYLVGMFLQANPSFSNRMTEALAVLTGRNPAQSRLFQLIAGMKKPDMMAAGFVIWEELVSIAGATQETNPLHASVFAAFFGKVAVSACEDVNRKFSSRAH